MANENATLRSVPLMPALRYEPLDPARFPPGEGPFRAHGLAYTAALTYVDTRLPGGRAGFLAALGAGDAHAPFFDQLFLVSGDYDLSPLVRLYVVSAAIKGVPVGRFIVERARWSAEANTKGIWRPLLKGSSPEGVADRLRHAFNRYFPPCHAATISVEPGRFEGELFKLPAPMSGVHQSATTGFFEGAMALSGATDVCVTWGTASPDGELAGVPIERVRFVVSWGGGR
jgi:hypothetical protein